MEHYILQNLKNHYLQPLFVGADFQQYGNSSFVDYTLLQTMSEDI